MTWTRPFPYFSADAYREAQLLELFGAERTTSLVTQTVLALRFEGCLPQTVKDVSLLLNNKSHLRIYYMSTF